MKKFNNGCYNSKKKLNLDFKTIFSIDEIALKQDEFIVVLVDLGPEKLIGLGSVTKTVRHKASPRRMGV